jgi:hypothetical protein
MERKDIETILQEIRTCKAYRDCVYVPGKHYRQDGPGKVEIRDLGISELSGSQAIIELVKPKHRLYFLLERKELELSFRPLLNIEDR